MLQKIMKINELSREIPKLDQGDDDSMRRNEIATEIEKLSREVWMELIGVPA